MGGVDGNRAVEIIGIGVNFRRPVKGENIISLKNETELRKTKERRLFVIRFVGVLTSNKKSFLCLERE